MPAHRTGVCKANPAHNDVEKRDPQGRKQKNPELGSDDAVLIIHQLQQINIIHAFRGLAGQCSSSCSSAQIALRPMAAQMWVCITIVIACCPWYPAKPQPNRPLDTQYFYKDLSG
ncbi:unnamed protein product [Fusarium equiseti]|uniref:Uncharacterized protein n=1 Tax=Fusarium equiseti TaxID=61235 RepID=A0A8J2IZU6_FUSEQ|nr:unnamed protein product [Fusarium equiseti]